MAGCSTSLGDVPSRLNTVKAEQRAEQKGRHVSEVEGFAQIARGDGVE